ncbi:MAG: pilus assembly protein [Acidobacteria bacterium]|nr:pilus assembly protein [Acidobacteriota bacterium]
MPSPVRRAHSKKRGAAVIDLALSFPLIFLMAIGTADFGRFFFHGMTVVASSNAGAIFGQKSHASIVDSNGMESMATNSATDVDAITATAEMYCDCPDSPASGPFDTANVIDCGLTTCPNGYGIPRVFVRTRVVHNFTTLGPYPGIPETTAISQAGYMRAQ